MLDLLYHKCNPLITIVETKNEKRQKKILFLLRYYNDEITINTKTPFLYGTCL